MILLISNLANDDAPAWIASLSAGAACLVTASDFYRSFGSKIMVNDLSLSSFISNGREIKTRDVTGVISTVSAFLPMEFYYVRPDDRLYVCNEINSFFNYFLSALSCKKINPPSRRSLSGFGLQRMEWTRIAHALGVPLRPFQMHNGKITYSETSAEIEAAPVTYIDNQIFGDVNEQTLHYVRLLAKSFSLPYLRCHFWLDEEGNYLLTDLTSVPDIAGHGERAAILAYFQSK